MSHDTEHAETIEKELVLKFFCQKPTGFFVEVGANDPVGGSQTWLLEQSGWWGILVEPQPKFQGRLRASRPRSKVHQVACSAPEKRGQARLHIANSDGFSTLAPQRDTHGVVFNDTQTVNVVTLDDLLAEEKVTRVDFVSIDVEGGELDVLRGFSLERYRPALVLIEDYVRNLDKHRHMTGRGYKLVKRTALNNWYVPEETKFTMTTFGERLELIRKMYLATPIRQWRLAVRRRQQRTEAARQP